MTIKNRLILMSGLLSALLIAVGIYGLLALAEANQGASVALKSDRMLVHAVDTARAAQVDFKIQVQEWKNVLLRGYDTKLFDKYFGKFTKREASVQADLSSLKGMMQELDIPTEKVDQLLHKHAELGRKYRAALQSYDKGNPYSPRIVDKLVRGIDRPPTKAMDELVELIRADSNSRMDAIALQGASTYSSARLNYVLFIVAGVFFATIFAFFIIRAISRPLSTAVSFVDGVAAGDLRSDVEVVSKDEIGALLIAMNAMSDKLRYIVGDVRRKIDNMKNASQEIATGNTDLSERTEKQASSLEETASSMEQMTSTVKQTADNVRHAKQFADAAREQAESSGEVVTKAVDAMSEINTASKKIADIIGVIDEIAFQTNLLALNAAVEAARAGEQGRGFAVVATEVRNLAQRSATAAKEIKGLINNSVEKVDIGSRLVDKSGETLVEIVGTVKKVSDIVTEIATAGQEQASGINQVNQAVMQMDEMTQQNAAMVEQVAAASRSMQEQALELSELMDFFKVDASNVVVPFLKETPMQASHAERYEADRPSEQAAEAQVKPKVIQQANARAVTKTGSDNSEWEEF